MTVGFELKINRINNIYLIRNRVQDCSWVAPGDIWYDIVSLWSYKYHSVALHHTPNEWAKSWIEQEIIVVCSKHDFRMFLWILIVIRQSFFRMIWEIFLKTYIQNNFLKPGTIFPLVVLLLAYNRKRSLNPREIQKNRKIGREISLSLLSLPSGGSIEILPIKQYILTIFKNI